VRSGVFIVEHRREMYLRGQPQLDSQQLCDKIKDLTVTVQTGKGKWHTTKSTLERAIPGQGQL
jgi:hypothetical protein